MISARLRSLWRDGVGLRGSVRAQITGVWYDDDDWVVRYVSARAGTRSFVIPTPLLSVGERHWITLRSDARESYPQAQWPTDAQQDHTVSRAITRAEECELLAWYHLPPYWGGSGLWGDSLYPSELAVDETRRAHDPALACEERAETRIHAAQEVMGDSVACPDGVYGWVYDLVLDLERWSVKYLIVRPLPVPAEGGTAPVSASLSDREEPAPAEIAADDALISPFWGTWHSADDQICVPFTRATIRASPRREPDTLDANDDDTLARYYGFARNW